MLSVEILSTSAKLYENPNQNGLQWVNDLEANRRSSNDIGIAASQ